MIAFTDDAFPPSHDDNLPSAVAPSHDNGSVLLSSDDELPPILPLSHDHSMPLDVCQLHSDGPHIIHTYTVIGEENRRHILNHRGLRD
jgi:hypothetical protein